MITPRCHASRPCGIAVAQPDDLPILIRNSAQAHAKSVEPKLVQLGAVIKLIMVIA
jgi:hypothetical protein